MTLVVLLLVLVPCIGIMFWFLKTGKGSRYLNNLFFVHCFFFMVLFFQFYNQSSDGISFTHHANGIPLLCFIGTGLICLGIALRKPGSKGMKIYLWCLVPFSVIAIWLMLLLNKPEQAIAINPALELRKLNKVSHSVSDHYYIAKKLNVIFEKNIPVNIPPGTAFTTKNILIEPVVADSLVPIIFITTKGDSVRSVTNVK